MSKLTRRQAMLAAMGTAFSLALGAEAISASQAQKLDGLEKRVRMGFIGVGDRGTSLLRVALTYPQSEVLAVCDIDSQAMKRSQDIVEQARGSRPQGFDKDA